MKRPLLASILALTMALALRPAWAQIGLKFWAAFS